MEPSRTFAVVSGEVRMDKNLDDAVETILAAADGDARRALRDTLIEMAKLHAELAQLYAVSEHGKKPATKFSLH